MRKRKEKKNSTKSLVLESLPLSTEYVGMLWIVLMCIVHDVLNTI